MYRLYYHPLCPFSRKIIIHLAAKELSFDLNIENFWERRKEFIALNPAGNVPVIFDNQNENLVIGSSVIIEYIEEKHPESINFLGESFVMRSEVRRLQSWFDEKFFNEVSKLILNERYFNRFLPGSLAPESEILHVARKNLSVHFGYIEYLLESRKYIAYDKISVADFAAAAHISSVDYFGDINWNYYPTVKDWYCLVKSHRIFSEMLKIRISNVTPPEWYSKLDF